MKNASPQTIRLKDYSAPDFLVDTVNLRFELFEEYTLVHSTLALKRNPKSINRKAPLVLDGEKLELLELKLDGKVLSNSEYQVTETHLTLMQVPEKFSFSCITKIKPQENTTLEGLYKSSGMFCTQCEAQGFRKITYYLDRPDVMATFTTTLEADKSKYPILLSNGNRRETKDLADGRHSATWNDPHKKPAYLYALVAGDLAFVEDHFVTASNRKVKLEIYVNKGNEDRCAHAMESLKRSMKWDEERFGLEYDLDIFMIVAVDDFNFGAMENKGLNIFNSSFILAKPSTATDTDYENIEAVVAHEYFHNWTGNRVTCRDWFQLSLKEGLTVYRDQEFTSDMMSRAVKRIEDVNGLRNYQFAEDAGPMAHPIRPDSYMEINNFYTATVYEKGAEVIRMIATILGREKFRRGIDKYFELFDGQAVTTEDFVHAMELASGVDLTQFRDTWYNQAGTPVLDVRSEYNSKEKKYQLFVKQSCPPTPGQPQKKPFHIPLAVALLDSKTGNVVKEELLHVKKEQEEFVFSGIDAPVIPSLLRNFSAPVHVKYEYAEADSLFLLSHDNDPFARFEAGQNLSLRVLQRLIDACIQNKPMHVDKSYLDAFGKLLRDQSLDHSFLANLLSLPEEGYLAQLQAVIDVDAIHKARDFLEKQIALHNEAEFARRYRELRDREGYEYSAKAVGKRSLKNTCLAMLTTTGKEEYVRFALEQLKDASNMTDEIGALDALIHVDHAAREESFDHFYKKWNKETLVMNKWLLKQASSSVPGGLERVKRLMKDPVFQINNPNKVYSLIMGFGRLNTVQFHAKDGAAYKFYADLVMDIDGRNPSVASRVVSLFNAWKKYDGERQKLMRMELERILAKKDLSPNVYEIVSKALA